MELTVTLGWWLLPLTITFIAFGAAYLANPGRRPPSGYGDIGGAFVALVNVGGALVVSLIAWLVWAVLT